MEAMYAIAISFTLLLAFPAARCDESSIVTELLTSKFSGFVQLLDNANLLDDLDAQASKPEGITILPITDNYLVNKMSPVLLSWLKKERNLPTLRRILMNHFIPGKVQYIGSEGHLTSVLGSTMEVRQVDGVKFIGGVQIKEMNALRSPDGVAHSVEGIVFPPDVKSELAPFVNSKFDSSRLSRSHSAWKKLARVALVSEDSAMAPTLPPPSTPVESPGESPASSPEGSPEASPPSSPSSSPAEAPTPAEESSPSPSEPSTPSASPSSSPSPSSPAVSPSAPAPSPSSSIGVLLNALENDGSFSSLLTLLNNSEVESVVEDLLQQPVSMLAPTDAAFDNVSNETLTLLAEKGLIAQIIQYHFITEQLSVDQFKTGTQAINGPSKISENDPIFLYPTGLSKVDISVRVSGDNVTFGSNNASISKTLDVNSDTIELYGIDQVLIPAEILVQIAPAPAPSSSVVTLVDWRMVSVAVALILGIVF